MKIYPSTRQFKKYMAVFDNGKIIHFGDKRYEDYTIHKDDNRKRLYLKRHFKNEDWNTPYNAGSLSRWILWHKSSIEESLKDFKKRFKL